MRLSTFFRLLGLMIGLCCAFAHPALAQDSANDVAKQRIEEALANNFIRLDLSALGLKSVPAEIGQLTTLQELYLANNQLTTLPAEIGQLKALRTLDLVGNQISILPAHIGLLTSLEVLHLDSNGLLKLPPQIGDLVNLQQLDLDYNQLTTLPVTIGQLTALRGIDLSGNDVIGLPSQMGQLISLQALHLTNNPIKRLPVELGLLTQLTDLKLDGTPLIFPPKDIQAQGTKAILLYLRVQGVTTPTDTLFVPTPVLLPPMGLEEPPQIGVSFGGSILIGLGVAVIIFSALTLAFLSGRRSASEKKKRS